MSPSRCAGPQRAVNAVGSRDVGPASRSGPEGALSVGFPPVRTGLVDEPRLGEHLFVSPCWLVVDWHHPHRSSSMSASALPCAFGDACLLSPAAKDSSSPSRFSVVFVAQKGALKGSVSARLVDLQLCG